MSEYGKILKKFEGGQFRLSIFSIENFTEGDYYIQFMKEKYSHGYSQLIINSGNMLDIIESAIRDGWILIDVVIEDPSVDDSSIEQIRTLVNNIKKNNIYFNDLKSYLDWALDDGSIFIDRIRLAKKISDKNEYCDVFSKGVLFSGGKEALFSEHLKYVLERYLNGK